jgi:hypothetical protein
MAHTESHHLQLATHSDTPPSVAALRSPVAAQSQRAWSAAYPLLYQAGHGVARMALKAWVVNPTFRVCINEESSGLAILAAPLCDNLTPLKHPILWPTSSEERPRNADAVSATPMPNWFIGTAVVLRSIFLTTAVRAPVAPIFRGNESTAAGREIQHKAIAEEGLPSLARIACMTSEVVSRLHCWIRNWVFRSPSMLTLAMCLSRCKSSDLQA